MKATGNTLTPKVIAMSTYSYIRVSTSSQDLQKFKAEILLFANKNEMGHVNFIEETCTGKISWKNRKIAGLVEKLQEGDNLIFPELSRAGRSSLDVMSLLQLLSEKNVNVYSIKENWQLTDGIQSQIMAMFFSVFSDLERQYISQRTIEGLKQARLQGKILGRPKGKGKSCLDPHKEAIFALLANGSTKTWISRHYGCTVANLHHWLKMVEREAA